MNKVVITTLVALLGLLFVYAVSYGQEEVSLMHEVADARLAQIEAKLLLHAGEVPGLPADRLDRIEAIADHLLGQPAPVPVVPDELKVNLNTGSLVELMSLDGIGKSKGGDIITSREADGPFTGWEDIIARRIGVGPATYEDLILEGRAYIE